MSAGLLGTERDSPSLEQCIMKYFPREIALLAALDVKCLLASHAELVQFVSKTPHTEECKFREMLCSQPGCGEIHTITPCTCGRDAILEKAERNE